VIHLSVDDRVVPGAPQLQQKPGPGPPPPPVEPQHAPNVRVAIEYRRACRRRQNVHLHCRMRVGDRADGACRHEQVADALVSHEQHAMLAGPPVWHAAARSRRKRGD
jgi:hypothetical protein